MKNNIEMTVKNIVFKILAYKSMLYLIRFIFHWNFQILYKITHNSIYKILNLKSKI